MLVPVVIFAQVEVPDGTADESLGDEVQKVVGSLSGLLGVVGWEIVKEAPLRR